MEELEDNRTKSMSQSASRWTSDRIVSMSAIFISLMTLCTFVYQNRLLQKQATMSVLPYLAISTSFNDGADPLFRLRLVNRGVGPAIIESQEIRHDGKTYQKDFFEFLSEHIQGLDSMEISRTSFEFGSVLPSGEGMNIISVSGDRDEVNLVAYTMNQLDESGLKYEIVYRSIYGERWKITESTDLPIVLPNL